MPRPALLLFLLAAIPAAGQTAAPHAVAERFFRAYGSGDTDAAMREWTPSPMARRIESELRQLFRVRCIELRSVAFLPVVENGDTARVEALVDLVSTPLERGRKYERIQRHILRLQREQGAWRIATWLTAEDDLVQRMEAAPDDAAAAAILAAEATLIDEPLIEAFTIEYDRAVHGRRTKDMRFIGRWMVSIASQMGSPAAMATALPIAMEMERRPGGDRAMLRARLLEGLQLAETGHDYDAQASALNILAITYMDEDESSVDALHCFDRIIEMRDAISRIRTIELALQNRGACLFARQNYRGAYQQLAEAIDYSRALGRISPASFCELYLGRIHERENDPVLAIAHYKRGLASEGWPATEVQLRLGLASSYRNAGEAANADAELEKALAIATPLHLDGLVSMALTAKSDSAATRGDLAAAAKLAEDAVAAARRAKYRPGEFDALLTLAHVHYQARRYDDALRLLADVDALSDRADFPGNERYSSRLLAARSHTALGHADDAMQAYRDAIARVEEVRGNVSGSERESRLFFEPYQVAYTELVALLVGRGDVEEALRVAEQAKGRVLLEALGSRAQNDEALPAAEREERAKRLAALTRVNRQLVAARAAEHASAARIAALDEEARRARIALDDLQAQLATRYPRFGRGETPLATPSQLAALVTNPELALVEYVVQNDATFAFVISRGTGGRAHIDVRRIAVRRADLEQAVERYADAVAAHDLAFEPPSRRLHRLLIEPLMKDLAGKKIVGIAPDGALWRVPFASLIGTDGRFVAERLALFYIPSLSVYRQFTLQQRSSGGPSLVAFADPAIAARTRNAVTATRRGAELGPLPNARSEVERIARLYGAKSRVFTGSAAFEQRAKANLGDARVIHFATHGLADDRSPMYSHVLLAEGPRANHDDGVLEAWELMQLDVGAELVVLSACDTGRGRVGAGEGLVGLSWALFVAGCPSTVVTLWKVRSDTTADEMVAFHRHLRANEKSDFAAKARALAAAQREMLRNPARRHPFYWAPFIVIGKP